MSHDSQNYIKPVYQLYDEFVQYAADHNDRLVTEVFEEFCSENDLPVPVRLALELKVLDLSDD